MWCARMNSAQCYFSIGRAFGPRSASVRPRRPLLGSRRGVAIQSQPTRPRRSRGNVAAGGRGRYRSTERGPVTVCRHNLGGRPPRWAAEPPISRSRASRPPGTCGARRIGLAEYPVYDPQTGVARDPWVTEAAMCVRLVDVRITCGLHDDAQIAAVFIDPRAK